MKSILAVHCARLTCADTHYRNMTMNMPSDVSKVQNVFEGKFSKQNHAHIPGKLERTQYLFHVVGRRLPTQTLFSMFLKTDRACVARDQVQSPTGRNFCGWLWSDVIMFTQKGRLRHRNMRGNGIRRQLCFITSGRAWDVQNPEAQPIYQIAPDSDIVVH